ncbi:hypothetical protein ES705_38381 [subsurface metagenome]
MFQCPVCSASLKTERNMVRHLLLVHGDDRGPGGAAGRRWRCEFQVRRLFDFGGWSLYQCQGCGGFFVARSGAKRAGAPPFVAFKSFGLN